MGLYIFFIIGGPVSGVRVVCEINSAFLHYFMLVYFGWTSAECINLYLKLVKVWGGSNLVARHYVLKAGAIIWCKFACFFFLLSFVVVVYCCLLLLFIVACDTVCIFALFKSYRPWPLTLYDPATQLFLHDTYIHVSSRHFAVVPVLIVAVSAGAGNRFYFNDFL